MTFDINRTIISQYSNSPVLRGMILSFAECVDPTKNLDSFYDLVWNVDTAQGYGLDVWGRIVGVSRVLQVLADDFFGFEEGDGQPFNQGTFFTGSGLTDNYALSDDAYRTLILTKALANISDGSVKSINKILSSLFPGAGNAYATDEHDMTMTYTFDFTLTPVQRAIVEQSGALPRPAGVSATVVDI